MISGSTNTDPIVEECDTCYSDSDFVAYAKQINPDNSINYYLFYNESALLLRTVYAASLNESQSNLPIFKNASIISNLSIHIAMFDDYKLFLASGAQKTTLELDFPSSGPLSASGYNNFLATHVIGQLQQWVMAYKNLNGTKIFNLFSFKKYSHIEVTFSNGDVVTLAVTGFASIVNFPVLFVVDENGVVLGVIGSNGTSVSQVNNGQGTLFVLITGLTICWGECEIPDTNIIISRD